MTGIPWAKWFGQVDDHAHDHGARQSRLRLGQVNGSFRRSAWPLREVEPFSKRRSSIRSQCLRPPVGPRSDQWDLQDRVDEVLEMVGLTSVARKRTGTFSLGMGQRLGIAAALLGDPGSSCSTNQSTDLTPKGSDGADSAQRLASEGRTVLVSSHLMSEMALTADHLVVIGSGRLIAEQPVAEFIAQSSGQHVLSGTRTARAPTTALVEAGAGIEPDPTVPWK